MNLQQLQKICPFLSLADATLVLQGITDSASSYGLTTPKRLACFFGQVLQESSGFTHLIENLNYSAEGLIRTFPKYFSAISAAKHARHAEEIANIVYANRMGNGDVESGDGWKYRGRGGIMATGKDMYRKLSEAFGVDFVEKPELLEELDWAVKSAIWIYCVEKKCAGLGDNPTVKIIEAITRRINGGTTGLVDRIALTNKALLVLNN